jgi:hypothetical protein
MTRLIWLAAVKLPDKKNEELVLASSTPSGISDMLPNQVPWRPMRMTVPGAYG